MENTNYKEEWDSYLIPGKNVLKNHLGILDYDSLQEEEKKIVRNKLVQLYLNPIQGKFDANHLKIIHKFIFVDIYPFAGEYRRVNLAKSRGSFVQIDDRITINQK